MLERVREYRHKLVILKQIMSNKARAYGRVNIGVKIGTVVVSALLTFMGFAGIEKIHTYLSWVASPSMEQVEFAFNLGVFALFVLIILHLVFRFSEREADASKAIVSITYLKNTVDDLLLRAESGYQVSIQDADVLRQKYEMLIQTLPANSDREYLKAKREVPEKQAKKLTLQMSAHDLFDSRRQDEALRALVHKSDSIMQVLSTLESVDERLYLAGGIVRNAVWDYLHGYPSATPPEDVDVVYFDASTPDKAQDKALERRLYNMEPNVRWSVKNQARMHAINSEPPYSSLEDAVSKWPETATAMVLRRTDGGAVDLVAPCGLDDLFRMVVRPTPHFEGKLDRYRERLNRKKWEANWPRLTFIDRE